jgi:glycosyltransferase involved in cell wall biosynthesis
MEERKPRISVVIPVLDEEESVPSLAAEVTEALAAGPWSWECIWVNDGSTDGTQALLEELAAGPGGHRFLELDGRFGQSAAMAAGFAAARGELVATLDGDGQNEPRDIPRLIRHLESRGVDMVNGVRQKRRDSWVRKASSRIANGFRNRLTHETVTDVGCSLRVCRRECLQDLFVFKGMHRFLPTLVRMRGYTIDEIPVGHRPREKGKTKYGIHNRLWVGLADTFGVRWMQSRRVQARVRRAGE